VVERQSKFTFLVVFQQVFLSLRHQGRETRLFRVQNRTRLRHEVEKRPHKDEAKNEGDDAFRAGCVGG